MIEKFNHLEKCILKTHVIDYTIIERVFLNF